MRGAGRHVAAPHGIGEPGVPQADARVTTGDDPERTLMRSTRPAPAEPPMHVVSLRGEAGEAPRRLVLGETPLRIGRVPENALDLPAPEVSRHHASLVVAGGQAILTDLGSTNGCFLDGRRVAGNAVLRPGMCIGIGPFLLDYACGPRRDMERALGLEKDVARANRYVQALLPAPIQAGPIGVAWRFAPSASVGGDGFGYRWLDGDRFALYLIDVAGHGVGSALLAASVLNMLREKAGPDPLAVLAGLNASFQMEAQGGLHFTLWYGVVDLPARRIDYASAGHHPAFLLAAGRATPLGLRNPPIGMMPAPAFRTAALPLPPDARLLLFSDGLFETQGPDGRPRGLAAFAPLLDGFAKPIPDETPEILLDRLLDLARGRAPGQAFDDDVAILLLDLLPTAGQS